jgi:AcrR family transcriptional regulator
VPPALLDAAFRIFAEKGYAGTRLEEVAQAAGMTKGAIYYHTRGKEDLLRLAVRDRHRAIFTEIAEALEGDALQGPASSRIRFVLRQVWNHWLEPGWGHALRLMLGEVSTEFPALFRMWAEVGPVHGWRLIASLIEEGVEAGEFRREVDPEVAARLVLSGLMLQSTLQIHLGLDDLAPCDPDRIFDSSVELFVRGLVAPGARDGLGSRTASP